MCVHHLKCYISKNFIVESVVRKLMSLGAFLFRPVIIVGPGRRRSSNVDVVVIISLLLLLSTLLTLCRCQKNIDECQIYPNCQNNGTCTDLVNGYNCTCTESFTGDNCEFKVKYYLRLLLKFDLLIENTILTDF